MQEREKKKLTTSKIAGFGLMVALAFIFSYIESLFPIYLGIPGAKPGFANIVTLIALYFMGPFEAFFMSIVRVLLTGFTFGNLYSLIYSLSGSILSFFVMICLKKTKRFGIVGVSAAGGVAHNIGQWIIAMLVLGRAVFYYVPLLLLVGTVTGIFVGYVAFFVLRAISKRIGNEF